MERPLRDAAKLFSVLRKVVNSAGSRVASVRGLTTRHPKLIVFYNFDYELEILRELGSSLENSTTKDFKVAEWNGHKHQEIPTSERWLYLVQYVAGSEGWNCIETDAMVLYSQTYSYKNHYQAFGRIDRMNTPFSVLKYYRLVSDSTMDKMIGRSLKEKKNFNEREMAKSIEFSTN